MSVDLGPALDRAKPIADAVLYEGYLLYPYRSSATKNQVRWQFGVLMPPAYARSGTGERERISVECLGDEPGAGARLHIRVRFLRLQSRFAQVHEGGRYRTVPVLRVGEIELTTWDEAVEEELDIEFSVTELLSDERVVGFDLPVGEDTEPVRDPAGNLIGRLTRRRWPISGELRCRAEGLSGPYGGIRIYLSIANAWTRANAGAGRDVALRHALIAAHAVLAIHDSEFISLLDPPEWAKPAAQACHQDGAWPVLVGTDGQRDVLLASPIILYDYPGIAPESPMNMFDGTEIDEILTLRTLALTDEEKREARATDQRARELIDHVDSMPAPLWDRLHGTVRYLRSVTGADKLPTFGETNAEDDSSAITARPSVPWWDPGADASVSPETDSIQVNGVSVGKGSRVLLRPGRKRSDAQDMFLCGRIAIVQAVIFDVDGEKYLAVTLENDPGAELEIAQGRFRYFSPEEIEPLERRSESATETSRNRGRR